MANNVSVFKDFPEKEMLLEWHEGLDQYDLPEINGHIHTPHSFSAFSGIPQAFQLAGEQGVNVLGINDFYTTNGYDEFVDCAVDFSIFPLFNIEFMGLQKELMEKGVRVNDPNNPGRTYFSGKGLRQPSQMSEKSRQVIDRLIQESNRQTGEMVQKVNSLFASVGINIELSVAEIKTKLARELLRERHIAQAIRIAVFEKENSEKGLTELLRKIFMGQTPQSSILNAAALENEIRGKLLKSGGAAFVPEDPDAFLSLQEVKELIIDAGGIPCYPVLLDFGDGNYTDFEANKDKLYEQLVQEEVYSIELIPGRNQFSHLKEFVTFFNEKGFIITFGTEHNTPVLDPLKVSAGGGVNLDHELKKINYEGAAVIAAHQYLMAKGEEGFLNSGVAKIQEKGEFVKLGMAVIQWFLRKDN